MTDSRHSADLASSRVPFLLALCPLLVASATLLRAAALSAALCIVLLIASIASVPLNRWLVRALRLPALGLVIATTAAGIELCLNAWLHGIFQSLEMFVALLGANCAAYLYFSRDLTDAPPSSVAPSIRALRLGGAVLLTMLVLGTAREVVGYGALLHDARAVFGPEWQHGYVSFFKADMGFLLAVLPPGAFMSAGVLFTLLNLRKKTA
jgi:electron transport complex protein RnfE